mmetsp:Transcript_35118/g.74140  ORF Transcript_35118/g.74140 Transcript_35118/m.74140 type:complete len:520 (+) Transcript_35118:1037-2596(+)
MAAIIGVLLGSQDRTGINGETPSITAQSPNNGTNGNSPTSSAMSQPSSVNALPYYADRGKHCCVTERGRQPRSDDDIGKNLFQTVEECCETEFWFRKDDECIMNSDSLSPLSNTQLSSLTWAQEGETLNGDAVDVLYDGGWFGASLCLSNDGRTLVIGAPGYYESTVGYVRVYRKDTDGWKKRGSTIRSASAADNFGRFLSISEDGDFVAIGAEGLHSNFRYEPYTQIYRWDKEDLSYKQIGQSFRGAVVSLSADAKTMAIGDHDYRDPNSADAMFMGQVTVYRWDEEYSEFQQQGYLPDPNNGKSFNKFRYYMSISSNGDTLALGIVQYNGSPPLTRVVKVYHRDHEYSNWKQLGDTFSGNKGPFGNSVSLSGDGKTLAISDLPGPGVGSTSIGQVKVYGRDDDSTDPNFKLLGVTNLGDLGYPVVGSPVSLSSDGKTLVVGDRSHFDNSGRVKIYSWDEDDLEFKQRGNSVYGEQAGGELGCSVSISSDGKTWAAGACRSGANGQDSGQVIVYSAEY